MLLEDNLTENLINLCRICVDTGRGCSLLLTSPLAASQNFEYKMSNILDKPLEVWKVLRELGSCLKHIFRRAFSVISACCLVLLVRTGTKPSSMDPMERVLWRPISAVKPCTAEVPAVLDCLVSVMNRDS